MMTTRRVKIRMKWRMKMRIKMGTERRIKLVMKMRMKIRMKWGMTLIVMITKTDEGGTEGKTQLTTATTLSTVSLQTNSSPSSC